MAPGLEDKLIRLRAGLPPRLLDLFAGCGGMTLGFQRAGCSPIGGVEVDPDAARSYATNFHAEFEGDRNLHSTPRDITNLDPIEYLHELGLRRPRDAVDILIGGPPCPAFTRVGRAKLREVRGRPDAYRHDPRAKLYVPYLAFVEALAPVALVMENVPDLLNHGGDNVAEQICITLERLGYCCRYTLLNAANYGVPQMRERFFLVAIHESARQVPEFPRPLCRVEFPPGYEGSRDVALKRVRSGELFAGPMRYVASPEARGPCRPPVTTEEAIGDLPTITAHLSGELTRGARRFDVEVSYRTDTIPSEYALEMRSWPHFRANGGLRDHTIRSLSPRDFRLFRAMKPGDEYPEAHALAVKLFERVLTSRSSSNGGLRHGSQTYRDLRSGFVPPYDPGKFPNKWRKMERDRPARTLMAHLGKDSYSHIHFDGAQARTISVREAARLQSFPDGFRFEGTMNPAFRQIGNAVPPLLAFAVARTLVKALRTTSDETSVRHQTAHRV